MQVKKLLITEAISLLVLHEKQDLRTSCEKALCSRQIPLRCMVHMFILTLRQPCYLTITREERMLLQQNLQNTSLQFKCPTQCSYIILSTQFPQPAIQSNILENKVHEKDDRSQTVIGTMDLREICLTDLLAA